MEIDKQTKIPISREALALVNTNGDGIATQDEANPALAKDQLRLNHEGKAVSNIPAVMSKDSVATAIKMLVIDALADHQKIPRYESAGKSNQRMRRLCATLETILTLATPPGVHVPARVNQLAREAHDNYKQSGPTKRNHHAAIQALEAIKLTLLK